MVTSASASTATAKAQGMHPTTVSSRIAPSLSDDPAKWTDKQIASRLVLPGIQMGSVRSALPYARAGFAGVVLFGTPPSNLGAQLRGLMDAAPGGNFLIASDEEGGRVQRLGKLLGRLPTASSIGSPAEAQRLSENYARKMRSIDVNVSLAPVADLYVRGMFIANDGRAFRGGPSEVAAMVSAWIRGSTEGGVMSVVKHWPGHGSAADTHVGSGRTKPWSKVRKAELIPFNAACAAGVGGVMVGHLQVPGLTGNRPASISAPAMKALRNSACRDALIMTDSLSMAGVHLPVTAAAVQSLKAGADVALFEGTNPFKVVNAITKAISNGSLPREQAIASARRVITAQQRWS